MIPQIIYICLFLVNLMLSSHLHGKEKKGKHSVWPTIISAAIIIPLLYLGGFFDPLFK